MIQEVKVKFYNKSMGIGYNDFRKVFCEKTNTWHDVKEHLGRLVFGKSRIPFNRVRKSISHKDFIMQQFIPF